MPLTTHRPEAQLPILPSGLQVPPAGICHTIRLRHGNKGHMPYRSEAKAGKGKDSEECETHNAASLRIEVLEPVQRSLLLL
jgi:hypothetical protein